MSNTFIIILDHLHLISNQHFFKSNRDQGKQVFLINLKD